MSFNRLTKLIFNAKSLIMQAKHPHAMPGTLLPAQARSLWKSSSVPHPTALCREICDTNMDADCAEQVAACMEAGVSRGTATVTVSRWRRANGKIQ